MRLKTLVAVALFAVVSCAQAQPPEGIYALDSFRVEAAPTPNESYLLKQMQTTVAACLSGPISDLSSASPYVAGVWNNPGAVLESTTSWRVDDQTFHYRGGARVTFSNPRYDPERSRLHYGPKRVAQDAVVNSSGKTKLIQNASDVPVTVAYDESETLTNSNTMQVTKGVTLDVSSDTTETVGGGYAGVSAEVSMQQHFGVSMSEEESREKSTEGSHSEALHIEFDAAPAEYYLVTISKEHQTTYQDFDIDGVMDMDITIDLHRCDGRLRSHCPHDRQVKVQGVSGFQQWVYGYDTDYPEMQGFIAAAYSRTKNDINCVLDPNHRTVKVGGTNQQDLESNADYKVESLGHSVPDHLKHLPVDDANDVTGGGQ